LRIYNLINDAEGSRRYATFRWRSEEDNPATALFVGGPGSRVERPTSERLLQTDYLEDNSGAFYFEIPANEEREFTIKGSHRRLESSDTSGTLEFQRIEFGDDGAPWTFRIDIPLALSETVEVFPRKEDAYYPVFGGGDPEPQCSPSPGSQ
jgi:hypothetical protein